MQDEFIAFSEDSSLPGQYQPLVAIKSSSVVDENPFTYRELFKNDMNRIKETGTASASGWVFRKTSAG